MAIKVIPCHLEAIGRQECHNLGLLQAAHAGGARRVVRMRDRFMAEGCLCIVFECLGSSLHDAVKGGLLSPLPLALLRCIALQSMQGLAEVHNAGLIHADIKPQNILMGSQASHCLGASTAMPPSLPLHMAAQGGVSTPNSSAWTAQQTSNSSALDPSSTQVFLIDLGNAIVFSRKQEYEQEFELQPLGYRAPEVLLGCQNFGFAVDVWGLGMVLLELALKDRVVAATNAEHALAIVSDLLGPLPRQLVNSATLETRAAPYKAAVTQAVDVLADSGSPAHCAAALSLLLRQQKSHWAAVPHLVGFLGGCLALDPEQRMSPLQALQHPFLEELFPLRSVLPPSAVEAIHRCSVNSEGNAPRLPQQQLKIKGTAKLTGAERRRPVATSPGKAPPETKTRGAKRPRTGLSSLGSLAKQSTANM